MSRLAPEALLWDVDGTLAETELDGHRLAFNRAMAEAGLPWQWDPSLYLTLLQVTGGRERMAVFLEQAEGQRPSEDRLEALQCAKQRHYSELVAAAAKWATGSWELEALRVARTVSPAPRAAVTP